jgi:ABC-2 type transport system permease protein
VTAPTHLAPEPAPGAGHRSVQLGPIIAYTLRSCIGSRRLLGCLLPCLGAILFGLISLAVDEPAPEAFARVATNGIFPLVIPIAALVIGDALLGAEVRSGVFHFTWLSPTSLTQIVIGRWLGGALVVMVTIVPACALAAVVAGDSASAGAAAVGAGAGALAYLAVFIAFGCVARRAAVWSLAYVFFVERLLGSALTSVAQWSPQWESRAVFVGLAPDVPRDLVRDGIPGGSGATTRLIVMTVIALVIARWRLARIKLSGAAD